MKFALLVVASQLFSTSMAFFPGSSQPANPVARRQVTRAQIEARALYRDLSRKMGKRDPAASLVCPDNAIIPAKDGSSMTGCCPTGQQYTGTDSVDCCPAAQVYGCEEDQCCVNGQVSSDGFKCCTAGLDSDGKCIPTAAPAPPTEQKQKRAKPKGLIKREGHRTLLDAELTAQYLLNDGEFEHEGVTYIDHAFREDNQKAWLKTFRSGSVKLLNMASHSSKLGKMFPIMFQQDEQALSSQFKFRVEDTFEIMEHLKDEFKPFEWRGIQFDKATLLGLVSHAPGFNASTFAGWA